MEFKNFSNENLITSTENAIARERDTTLEVLHHFREIEKRRLYAERGFSSLYDMAKKHFGYGEGEAYRRISAMRLLKDVPELEQKIEDGSLSLTIAAKVHTFARKNKRDAREIARAVDGKSTREAELELLKIVPEAIPQERVRQVTEEHTAVTVVLDKELKDTLDELKALRSHVDPAMNYADLIRQLAKLGKEKWGRHQRNAASARMSKAEEDREVLRRAGEQCEFVDEETGRRCDSNHLLEVDHIVPLAAGGEDTFENKRILCRTHNQLAAIHKLGRQKMAPYLRF